MIERTILPPVPIEPARVRISSIARHYAVPAHAVRPVLAAVERGGAIRCEWYPDQTVRIWAVNQDFDRADTLVGAGFDAWLSISGSLVPPGWSRRH